MPNHPTADFKVFLKKTESYLVKMVFIMAILAACTACQWFARSASSPKDSTALFRQGMAYWQEGKLVQAEVHLRAAVEKDSSLIPAYFALTRIYMKWNQFPRALKMVRRILSKDRQQKNGRFLRAKIYYLQGSYEFARDDLEWLVKHPFTDKQKEAHKEVSLLLARCLEQTGPYSRAIGVYRKLAAEFPQDSELEQHLKKLKEQFDTLTDGQPQLAKIAAKNTVNRRDFAVILSLTLYDFLSAGQPATDLSRNRYAVNAIRRVVQQGWMPLFPDHTFRPEDLVDRAEAALFLSRVFKRIRPDLSRNYLKQCASVQFTDLPQIHPIHDDLALLVKLKIFYVNGSGAFRLRSHITGWQALQAVSRLKKVLKRPLLPLNPQR